MDSRLLTELIEAGKSQRQIADHFGVSQSTIKYWLRKHQLSTMHHSFNARDGLRCKFCSETDVSRFYKNRDGYMRGWCKKCHNKYAVKRFRQYKMEAVAYKGGSCEMCGYNKCMASLDFHHKDPSQKDPKWSRMRSWKFEKIKSELDKCMLVCRNCHGELHYQEWSTMGCTQCGKPVDLQGHLYYACWCGRLWCSKNCAEQSGWIWKGDNTKTKEVSCKFCRKSD